MAVRSGTVVTATAAETINMSEAWLDGTVFAVGSEGDDLIRGNALDNYIAGNGGNDYLWGGTGGNDMLVGGTGNNAYWWGYGDGTDTIVSTSSGDVLVEYNVAFLDNQRRFNGADLVIPLNGADTVWLKNWQITPATRRLQSFLCSDNTLYLWNNGAGAVVGLYQQNYVDWGVTHVSAAYESGNCLILGGPLGDWLEGGAGNDQIWGGGTSPDIMSGGAGINTYWWGGGDKDGMDIITYHADNAKSVVRLYGLTKGKVTLALSGTDLLITSGGGALTIQNWSGAQLDKLQCDDGVLSAKTLVK